ncbi:hypothetical protein MRX96_001215 [Rhipicephalus microplus]
MAPSPFASFITGTSSPKHVRRGLNRLRVFSFQPLRKAVRWRWRRPFGKPSLPTFPYRSLRSPLNPSPHSSTFPFGLFTTALRLTDEILALTYAIATLRLPLLPGNAPYMFRAGILQPCRVTGSGLARLTD